MDKLWLRIAITISSGFMIGALMAISLGILWPLGALAGGAVAYVLADLPNFWQGIEYAWRRTTSWRPYKLYWVCLLRNVVLLLVLQVYVAPIMMLLIGHQEKTTLELLAIVSVVYAVLLPFFTLMFILPFLPTRRKEENAEQVYRRALLRSLVKTQRVLRTLAPASLARSIIQMIPELMISTRDVAVAVTRATVAFIRTLFVYVHSQLRTICFVDTTLAVSAAMILDGTPLVMAASLVGGILFGYFNYWVVSIRWLKLIPRLG